jgi:hypothetical protein
MASRFRTALRYMLPRWLGGGPDPKPGQETEDRLVIYSLGVLKDAFAERARQGLLARFPEYAPESSLAVIGRDRQIIRGVGESSAAYAARLIEWRYPRGHRIRGNAFALLNQLAAYLQASVLLRTVDRRGNWYTRAANGVESYLWDQGNWDWDGRAVTNWSRWWTIIYHWEPHPQLLGAWGNELTPGRGYTLGQTATPADVAAIGNLTAHWKPAGTRRETIVIAFDTDDFPPTGDGSEPGGEWANYSANVAGVQTPVRRANARYWAYS